MFKLKSIPFFFYLLPFLFLSSTSFAKKFASQYCEFELPPGWECSLEGTEWVCQSENKDRQKEAIIILAAKIRGEQDSLDHYQNYLKDRKSFKLPGGKTLVSEPKYSEVKTINNHQWIDALHLASEVPGFYTRYLATVKSDLGVAVTFSVSKDHYASYQSVFDQIVGTLRVFRQLATTADSDFKLKKKDDDLLDDTAFIPEGMDKSGIGVKKQKDAPAEKGKSKTLIYVIILAAAAFVGFKFLSKKKNIDNKGLKKKTQKNDGEEK
jgi:hypothetical protein